MFLRLSGMGGPAVFAVISALLFTAGGRPQIGEYIPVSRSIIPFDKSDSRDTIIMEDRRLTYTEQRQSSQTERRQPPQMEQRPRQGIVYNDEPYRPRVRSDQIQHSSATSHDRPIVLDPARAKDRKNTNEQPVWLPKSETQSTERRDGSSRPQSSTTHAQDKRGNTHTENRGPANRGQQNNANRPLTRMGTIEAVDDNHSISRNESIGDSRRIFPSSMASKRNSGDIVFPGPTKDPSALPPRMQGSFIPPTPNCEGSTFCESTDNYPSEYLNTILKKQPDSYKEYFGRDEINELTQRIDLADETPLCPSLEQVVYPKVAQNKNDKWLYVVNHENYVQGVRVEKCLKQESQCSLTEGFPLGYKTVCRQKYIYRRMLALKEDGNTHEDMFRLPSCCACFVKSVGTSTDSSTD